jgi:hypothetical protein
MRRILFLLAALAAAAVLALPHGDGLTSPVGQLRSVSAMLRCEAQNLAQVAHDPSGVATTRRCLAG